jgi:hypothetical protein
MSVAVGLSVFYGQNLNQNLTPRFRGDPVYSQGTSQKLQLKMDTAPYDWLTPPNQSDNKPICKILYSETKQKFNDYE